MASQRASATVDFSGPLFKANVDKTFFENVSRMMDGIAEEGAATAREGLMTGSGNRALITELGDRVADHVIGRTEARPSRGGRDWTTAAVIQVYNEGLTAKQGVSLMAAASYVQSRTRAISRVRTQIRAERANLTAGLE